MSKLLSALIGIALFFGGCTIKSSPPIDEYTIVFKQDRNPIPIHESKCSTESVKLLEPFGAYAYSTNDLHYVILPNEENSYNLATWSHSVSGTLYTEILRAVAKSGIFGSVTGYSSVAKSDLILEMEINDFKQYFSSDLKHSYVVADLTFTLIDAKGFRIVAQKEFVKKIDAKSLDAKGGVGALDDAFNQIVIEMLVWLRGVCT